MLDHAGGFVAPPKQSCHAFYIACIKHLANQCKAFERNTTQRPPTRTFADGLEAAALLADIFFFGTVEEYHRAVDGRPKKLPTAIRALKNALPQDTVGSRESSLPTQAPAAAAPLAAATGRDDLVHRIRMQLGRSNAAALGTREDVLRAALGGLHIVAKEAADALERSAKDAQMEKSYEERNDSLNNLSGPGIRKT
jgi:hypothetical protein